MIAKTKYGNISITKSGHYRISSNDKGFGGKLLHRVIYEEYYKCTILPFVDCHHINGIKTDNQIDNLTLMYHGEHSRYHNTGDRNPKANKGVKLSEETKAKISKAKKGKLLNPTPHIRLGGKTANNETRYRLVIEGKEVISSINKEKLISIMEEGTYTNYVRPHKYDLNLDMLKKEYGDGKTMQELANLFGCSRKTISRRLHKIYSDDEIKERMCNNISKKLMNDGKL